MLEPFLGKRRYANHGQRVVEDQCLMQPASDIMLGWYRVTAIDDLKRYFYFRQLWDANGSAIIEAMKPREVYAYAEICGRRLARAHARSGDAVTISAYLGSSDALDRATADCAELSADQKRHGPRRAERRHHDRARQGADGAVIRVSVSIPLIPFG